MRGGHAVESMFSGCKPFSTSSKPMFVSPYSWLHIAYGFTALYVMFISLGSRYCSVHNQSSFLESLHNRHKINGLVVLQQGVKDGEDQDCPLVMQPNHSDYLWFLSLSLVIDVVYVSLVGTIRGSFHPLQRGLYLILTSSWGSDGFCLVRALLSIAIEALMLVTDPRSCTMQVLKCIPF